MRSLHDQALYRLTLVAQALAVAVAMPIAVVLHADIHERFGLFRDTPSTDQMIVFPFLALPLFLGLLIAADLHRVRERPWARSELVLALVKVHFGALLTLGTFVYITNSVLNRSLTLIFLACSFSILYVVCAGTNGWRRYQHASGQGRERLLLVGDVGAPLECFLHECRKASLPPEVVGVLAQGSIRPTDVRDLGVPSALAQTLHENAVDHVFFFPPLHHSSHMGEAIAACDALGIPASFWLETPDRSVGEVRTGTLHGAHFVSFEYAPRSPEALAIKSITDLAIAALLVLIFAPILLLTSLAIWSTMGRPIFFTQLRAGLHGRVFRMLKFRTMVKDADKAQASLASRNEMTGPVFKIRGDPRITSLGRVLRRTSLDELPQLFHVLQGKMSLVGPRPLPLQEQRQIRGWHRRRLSMKPGLTGPWQVSGRNDVDFEEWMRLDLEYVDRWSFRRDLSLLIKTIPAVVLGRGAR